MRGGLFLISGPALLLMLAGGCASSDAPDLGEASNGVGAGSATTAVSTATQAKAPPPAAPASAGSQTPAVAVPPAVADPDPLAMGTAGAAAPAVPPPPPAVNTGTGAPLPAAEMPPPVPATMETPVPAGPVAPTVPEITGECPNFRSGTITYMGVRGIAVQAGSKAASPTAPMVFYWHGTGSVAGEYSGQAAAVHRGVLAEGGILISFQGTSGGDFLSGTLIFGAGDMKITDQLFACAVRDHNVDPTRIYATGCSAGGLFSNAQAAMRSTYIAAAAPNSGGLSIPVAFENDYTPALMTVHGAPGRDVVGIDFSDSSRTADTLFKGRGGFVINCNHGGGHCGGGRLSPQVWEFFKAHPYGVDPPWTGGLPSGWPSSCEIF